VSHNGKSVARGSPAFISARQLKHAPGNTSSIVARGNVATADNPRLMPTRAASADHRVACTNVSRLNGINWLSAGML
jgi:hypothetical protein